MKVSDNVQMVEFAVIQYVFAVDRFRSQPSLYCFSRVFLTSHLTINLFSYFLGPWHVNVRASFLCSFCSVSRTVGTSRPLSVTRISCLAKQMSAQGEKLSCSIHDFIYLVRFVLVFYLRLCQLQFFIRHFVKKKWPYRQERCDKCRLPPPACLESCIYTGEEESTS